jgi:ABC-type uncharacterized transport system involved in gliding motility auxiliary subunit
MSYKPLHILPNRLHRDVNLLFLLIPAVVFALLLAILVSSFRSKFTKEQLATFQESTVLGEEESVSK